tara:strand:+ start:239 stop:946 length:708 start_codon:yes stop_codon:yes gene_type:complete
LLIFDAGTGLRELAESLATGDPLHANLFLTHTHLDHVCGLPFFQPMFRHDTKLKIWGGHLPSDRSIRQVINCLMMDPLWPIQLDDLKAGITFHDFAAGETLAPSVGIDVQTVALNHPNGATGYRVNYKGKSVCYVTDTEHYPDRIDENIVELANNADILIYDSTYTPTDYKNRVGWGHSTWEEGVKLAKQAGVKQFVVFHHNPAHDDDDMDLIEREVCDVMKNAVVAREGMVLCP